MLRRRRPKPPTAYDVLTYSHWGGTGLRVEGDLAAARAAARRLRAADPGIVRVRIVPA